MHLEQSCYLNVTDTSILFVCIHTGIHDTLSILYVNHVNRRPVNRRFLVVCTPFTSIRMVTTVSWWFQKSTQLSIFY